MGRYGDAGRCCTPPPPHTPPLRGLKQQVPRGCLGTPARASPCPSVMLVRPSGPSLGHWTLDREGVLEDRTAPAVPPGRTFFFDSKNWIVQYPSHWTALAGNQRRLWCEMFVLNPPVVFTGPVGIDFALLFFVGSGLCLVGGRGSGRVPSESVVDGAGSY